MRVGLKCYLTPALVQFDSVGGCTWLRRLELPTAHVAEIIFKGACC